MATKLIITRAQLEACRPCSTHFFEQDQIWNGEALVFEDLDAEIQRLTTLHGGLELMWLGRVGLIPNFTLADAVAAINKTKEQKAK